MSQRTRTTDVDELRARIRTASIRVFALHGFKGTSVQAVADEVGLSKQALLYHVSNKDGLWTGALEEVRDRWIRLLPRMLASATLTTGDRVEAMLHELTDAIAEDPEITRFVMRAIMDAPNAAFDVLGSDSAEWFQVASAFLKQGQENGTVSRDLDPENWVISSGILLLGSMSVPDPSILDNPVRRQALLREVARMIIVSLSPR